jgi:hypothetical protein
MIASMKYILIVVSAILIFACKKDRDGRPESKPGDPVANRLSPDSAGSGTVLTLTGSGLGDMRSILFDKNNAAAAFYSTLNTSEAIVFRVPDTATRGDQNIVLTNSAGKQLLVPFRVLPFATVNNAFPTDFEANTEITLNGNNLDVLSKVVLNGANAEATILSRSLTKAVIRMPAGITADKGTLVLTTTAGEKATTMEFVNVEKAALKIFTDSLVNPAQNWGWGGTYTNSTDNIVTGTAGLKAAYDPAGTWGGLQIGMGTELPIPAGTRYFTFWAKGADVDKKVTVNIKGNKNTTDHKTEITVPANKWTYYKMETGTLIPNVNSISVIVFQIQNEGKTIYYDNIMFIK